MSICKRKSCTFIWTVENYAYSLEGVRYWSPPFQCSFKETDWLLSVGRGKDSKNDHTNFEILPSMRKNDPKIITEAKPGARQLVDLELSILASDGSVFVCEKQELTVDFFSGQYHPFCQGLFGDKREKFLPSGNLTVCFRLWKSGVELDKSTTIFGRTLIGMERLCFFYTLKDSTSSSPKEEHNLSIENKLKQLKSLKIKINENDPNTVGVTVVPVFDKDASVASSLKVSVLDYNGMVVKVYEDAQFLTKKEKDKQELFIPTLFREDKLIGDVSMYSPEDVFSLRCECLIYGKVIERYIEEKMVVLEGPTLLSTSFQRSDVSKNKTNSENTDSDTELEKKCIIM